MAGDITRNVADRTTGSDANSVTDRLRSRMQAQELTSFRALAQAAGVSEGQILQFRRGKVAQMRLGVLQQLAEALDWSLAELLALANVQAGSAEAAVVSAQMSQPEPVFQSESVPVSSAASELRAECDRLQQQLAQQETELRQRFQQESLYRLEAWMKNWPKVVHAVQTNRPDLAAVKVLPLVKPLEQLLKSWEVEATGSIGESLPYDPQTHQILRGQAQPGEAVVVARPGYRQGDRLLHRAEVHVPDHCG